LSSCKTDSSTKSDNNPENDTEIVETKNFTVPTELEYSNHDKMTFLYDKFYPVGWSETGLFAYVTEIADEGSGYYFFKISIQNMINDKIEWEWEPSYNEDGNLDSIWKENLTKINEKLNEYKIIQKTDFVLGLTSFTYLNKQYNLKIFTETEKNKDFGFDIIKSTKVYLSSPQLGTKTIYDYKEEDYSMLLGQIIAGYIQSPFEDRIAVIIKNERWGYEGPPNLIYFTIVGSNLTESFQPDTKK
jgi:hypothetical protein